MFVEISRGRSFKGLAQYCLQDVDRTGTERVAFVETCNLATDDPQIGWRIMAARHYLQDDLKRKAGVGPGGAKDGKPVGHLVLSWKKEEAEAEHLNHLGMVNAAHGALRAIGASKHQAIIIGHTDTPHPHCHVVINLIGDDGRLKKNWKEKQKLSKFALKREIEIHGEPIVKKRQKNWLDREAGETPVPVKKKPRHLYELDKAAKKCPQIKAFADKHHGALQELEREKAAQRQRQKRHRERLKWCLQERQRRTQEATQSKLRAGRSAVRREYQQKWERLLDQQAAQRRVFEQNERNLKGSLANAMKLIDWKQVLRRRRTPGQLRLGDAFQLLTNEGARRARSQKQQQAEHDRLRARQQREEQTRGEVVLKEQQAELAGQRKAYIAKAAAMKRRQAAGSKALKARQQLLTAERNEALQKFRERERQREQELRRAVLVRKPAPDQPPPASAPVPELSASFETKAEPEQKPERVRRPRKERPPRPPRASLANVADDVKPAVGNATETPPAEPDIEQHLLDRFERRRSRGKKR